MSFPQRLKAARLAAGRSQQEIADALGVDKTTYSGYETGRRQPDLFRLRRLSQVLEYSADQLLELGPAGAPSPEEWERVKKYPGGGGGALSEAGGHGAGQGIQPHGAARPGRGAGQRVGDLYQLLRPGGFRRPRGALE